jgi:hypothetical protein
MVRWELSRATVDNHPPDGSVFRARAAWMRPEDDLLDQAQEMIDPDDV